MPAASTKPKSLTEALLKTQKEMPDLQKNAINPHFGNRYISLDSLMEQVLPVLQANDLLLTQAPTEVDGGAALLTRFTHVPTGESVEATMPLILDRQNAQGLGSALTYARRYALMAWLGLVADEDDDANGAARSNSGSAQVVQHPAADELTELKNRVADIAVANGVERTGPAIAAHFGVPVEALQDRAELEKIVASAETAVASI